MPVLDKAELQRRLETIGQTHVLTFWDALNEQQRAALAADVAALPMETLAGLGEIATVGESAAPNEADLKPPTCFPVSPSGEMERTYADARSAGESLIADGRVAALTVAGGQGTRLGFDGPKGVFPISPIRDKTLFQLFAEMILAATRRYGRAIPWYIMTSPGNDAETQRYFNEHDLFGLKREDVTFFQQGGMPAFDNDGRILLEARDRIAMSPDGHGGTLTALRASGALADMASRGVEILSYFQVDNPLVHPVDPLFIGLHATTGSEMSSKAVAKTEPAEKVGVFANVRGRLDVIEYSDLPTELAGARTADGRLQFAAGSIAVHVISRGLVERLTSADSGVSLPWHRANKKVPFVDLSSGEAVEPVSPNAIKLEKFIFDAIPLAKNPLVLMTERGEEFSPVKNADGVDSPGTARRDMVRRAARWLTAAGVDVPAGADGEPACTVEISPLFAATAEAVREKATAGALPARLAAGSSEYFE